MNLDLDDNAVRYTLNSAVYKLKPLYKKLVGADGSLVELSCMFTCNISAQTAHVDQTSKMTHKEMYPRGDCSSMYSTFIALQPTPGYLGATTVLPKSHMEGNEIVLDAGDNQYDTYRINRKVIKQHLIMEKRKPYGMLNATLGAGDVLLYNSLTVHAAGENSLNLARMMFYYTFQSESPFPTIGSTYSIKKEYIKSLPEQVTLELLEKCKYDDQEKNWVGMMRILFIHPL